MDYYEIGQRIRRLRKANHLSQEQLAEKVGISVTHLSHIETGNTKLSLPVFVDIANELSVQTDELLYDIPISNNTLVKEEVLSLLESCNTKELYIIIDSIKALKTALNKYN